MIRCLARIILFPLLLFFLLPLSASGSRETMSVQVQEGLLRATPSHLGAISARVPYGDQVMLVEDRGDWKRVAAQSGRLQGWMHSTALTTKTIVFTAGEADAVASVSHGEIALAGKGFSKEVEAEYRQRNRNLDYRWVDRMEQAAAQPEQMRAFLAAGELNPDREGGRP